MNSRRDVLGMGTRVIGSATMAALAGCSDLPVVGTHTDESLDYREWTFDPETLDEPNITVTAIDIETLLAGDDPYGEDELREILEGTFHDELDADDVESFVSIAPLEILAGSFDAADIFEALDATSESGYEGFDVAFDEDRETMFASNGTFLVAMLGAASPDDASREVLELAIDTYNGDEARFVDTSDDFARITDEIEAGTHTTITGYADSSLEDEPDSSPVADASVASVDGEEADVDLAVLYADEEYADSERLESEIHAEQSGDEVEVEDSDVDGRLVRLEYAMAAEDYL
ncbi:hypothetical protein SAMN04487967_0605 [Natronorubrum sediminis]|uniref:Uncharacterized protein n=1 Tax=Natronorubrum sediminis TaxID=640943 RepID=A0A1H6FNS2_9EURY|nr:hypothetical protein [Natronorubrum sediminis]SEH11992.1 hypothetical protein SAMN04487967_0605 [Natronorubrum sediminis]